MQIWIKMKEATALTQMPERTLRYQLAQGKILGKKEGQSWRIELNSLKQAGLIKVLPLKNGSSDPPSHFPSQQDSSSLIPSPPTPSKNRSPCDLASFRALMEWRRALPASCEPVLPLAGQAAKILAAGYFEFSRTNKAVLYREARELLSHLWVELQFMKENGNTDAATPSVKLISEVIPALSGALKKIESGSKPPRTD